ncbi:MAG: hypothetical protein KDD64_16945 [Bdellovibrionales bacterium]|nr:hypothetical protein [Bdellovibrionales bacterium]
MATLRDYQASFLRRDSLLPSEVIPGLIASYRKKFPSEDDLQGDCEWLARQLNHYIETCCGVNCDGDTPSLLDGVQRERESPSLVELEIVEEQLEHGLEAVSELKFSICRAPFQVEGRRNEILVRLGSFQKKLSQMLLRVEEACRQKVLCAKRE